MPDDVNTDEEQDEEDVTDAESDEEDEEEEDDSEEEDEEDEESDEDDDQAGGSGDGKASTEAKPAVVAPTGKELLDLLAADPQAQALMRTGLEDIIAQRARESAAAADSEEFNKLIENQDYAGIGQRLVERTREAQTRENVTDAILKEQFGPIYADLFAQPEMKSLTAEDREKLDPTKFASDAHYVIAIERFVASKRSEAAIEAEVAKRVKTALEAKDNNAVGAKVKGKSIAGVSPVATGPVGGKVSSTDLIKRGLRAIFEPDGIDDDDE